MITRKSKNQFLVKVPCGETPVTTDDVRDMRLWCLQVLGEGGRNPKCKWRYGWVERQHTSFYFKKERDALMFVLRWS